MESLDQIKKDPYGNIIKKLLKKEEADPNANRDSATYEFTAPIKPDTSVKFETQKFNIKQIINPEDPRLNDVLKFLDKIFKSDTLNDPESFKRKLIGKTKDGAERPQYRCFYVTNQEDEIIGVRVAEEIPLISEGKIQQGKSIFYAIYIAIDEKYRGRNNIPVEMYIASLIDAKNNFKQKNLEYIIAECSPQTESLQNRIGLQRVYLEMSDGTKKEIEFFQPAMVFNEDTGKPTSSEAADHFMLYKTNQKELTKKDVYEAIASLIIQYKSNYLEGHFKTKDAYESYEKYFQQVLKKIQDQLDACESVTQMSREDRKDKTGITNFEAADENRPL